jgi:uncharacterized protein YbcC (UPF0753/DUF2309 family)
LLFIKNSSLDTEAKSILNALHEISDSFTRNFSDKKDIIVCSNNSNEAKKYYFEHKIKSQIEFNMKMVLDTCNEELIRSNTAILNIKKDLDETTDMVKHSLTQLDERGNMLMENEER